jgi:hypothetical protein
LKGQPGLPRQPLLKGQPGLLREPVSTNILHGIIYDRAPLYKIIQIILNVIGVVVVARLVSIPILTSVDSKINT